MPFSHIKDFLALSYRVDLVTPVLDLGASSYSPEVLLCAESGPVVL